MKQGVKCLLLGLALFSTTFSHADEKSQELAKVRTQLAVEYLRAGDLKTALDSANQALAAESRYMPAYMVRAYIYQTAKVDAKAEQDFRQALSIEPGNPEANNNFGWFLCERNRIDESLGYFQKALSDPFYRTPETARLNMGVCLGRLGRTEEANQQLLSALRTAPQFAGALRELARLQYQQRNNSLATDYFQRFDQSVGGRMSPEDLLLGVRIYQQAGNRAAETKYADDLRRRYPDSQEARQIGGY